MENPNEFNYTYAPMSDKERREVETIKNRYEPRVEKSDKLKRLKSLDDKVKNTPSIISLIFGIVGILIFGTGLSLVLEFELIFLGIIIAAVGIIPIALAYPVFTKCQARLMEKYRDEIIRLSNELLDE